MYRYTGTGKKTPGGTGSQRSTRRLRYRLPPGSFYRFQEIGHTDDTTNGIVIDSVTGDPISVISVSL